MKSNYSLSSTGWLLLLFASICDAQEATVTASEKSPEVPTVPQEWGEGKQTTSTSTSNTEPLVDSAPVDENDCFAPQEDLKRCLKTELPDAAVNDCLGCDRVPAAVSKQMVKKQLSLQDYNAQVCELLVDGGVCQQVCGVCFHVKQKVAACEWGCELSPILQDQDQPGRHFDPMPPSDEAHTEPGPLLPDISFLPNLEGHAPLCQDALDAIKQCVADDTPVILQDCMQCHKVQDLGEQLSSGSLSLADLQKSMCEEKPECYSVCGECYPAVHKLTTCTLGCDGPGFPPITFPESIENIPFFGGGGVSEENPLQVDVSRGCEDSMPAIEKCITNNMENQLNVLKDCMKCHNDVVDLAGREQLDPMMVKEKLCKKRPDCENICGPCYSEIHKMATCTLGCGSDVVHDIPAFPFPDTENTHGNDDIGKANQTTEFKTETTEQQDNIEIIDEKENDQSNKVDEDKDEAAEDSFENEVEPEREEIFPNVEGFNLQCQDAMELVMDCLTSHRDEVPARLDDCLICHKSTPENKSLATKDVSVAGIQTLMCGERLDCESVCGECYPEIHKYATCLAGCGHEGRPKGPSFPEKEDLDGFTDHGFNDGRPSNDQDQHGCENILPAVEECIFTNTTDQANVLEECMKCHSVTFDVLNPNMSSAFSFDEAVCTEWPDCDSACGACYPLISKYISCSAGCRDAIQGNHGDKDPNKDTLDSDRSSLPNLDGFEMQCQDDMEVAMECVYSYEENTTEVLDECLNCHDIRAFKDQLATDNATNADVDALLCADRPDCTSVCGKCYQEIHKFATCSVGCSHGELPARPSLPATDNHHGSDEQSVFGERPSKHYGQRRCKSVLSAVEECIATNMTDQADVLEQCMECHNATLDVPRQNISDIFDYNEELCAERPDCDNACGACYTVIHEFATCSYGCGGDNVTEIASYDHDVSKTHHEKKNNPRDSEDHNQKGHDKPERGKRRPFTAKYEQKVSVRLDGCTKLLNETEQEAYVTATEAFLKRKDSSVQVEFVGQRLVESGRKENNYGKVRHYRMLRETSVEVDTRIGSSNNEKPGNTAIEQIENDDKGFVEALQAVDTSSAFESVGVVQAEPAVEASSPTSAPVVTNGDGNKDNNNRAIMLWIGIGLLIVLVVAAVFYSVKLFHLLGGTSSKECKKSPEQSLLTKESARMDIGFNKDIFSHNFD